MEHDLRMGLSVWAIVAIVCNSVVGILILILFVILYKACKVPSHQENVPVFTAEPEQKNPEQKYLLNVNCWWLEDTEIRFCWMFLSQHWKLSNPPPFFSSTTPLSYKLFTLLHHQLHLICAIHWSSAKANCIKSCGKTNSNKRAQSSYLCCVPLRLSICLFTLLYTDLLLYSISFHHSKMLEKEERIRFTTHKCFVFFFR